MTNRKKPTGKIDNYIAEAKRTRQNLPLHKMCDVSRRQFIQSVGTFLGMVGLPAIIQTETMSKLARKVLGSSLAFADDFTSLVRPSIHLRSGYNLSWIVAHQKHNYDRINAPWAEVSYQSFVGNNPGVPLVLPPHSTILSPYAKSIQMISAIKSEGNHTHLFNGSHKIGIGNLVAMRAKTEIDGGLSPLLKTPTAFYDPTLVGLNNSSSDLADYTPTPYLRINDFINLFDPLHLQTNQGTTISDSIRDKLFTVQANKYADDLNKSALTKNQQFNLSTSDQAYTILRLQNNLKTKLDIHDPSNSAIKNILYTGNWYDPNDEENTVPMGGNGFPLNTVSGQSITIDPVAALFAMVQSSLLGISPFVSALGLRAGDWHDMNYLRTDPANANDARAPTAEFFANLIFYLLEAANSGSWTNPFTGSDVKIMLAFHSEFTRSFDIGLDENDADGGSNNMLVCHSDINQTLFKSGSYGGIDSSGVTYGFNVTGNSHVLGLPLFTSDNHFEEYARRYDIDLDDFGVRRETAIGL